MKILCFTDPHFCERSSIVSKYGNKYSLRLENQIESLNWVERTAEEKGCQLVVCLGDFFDKPHLTDQELTALKEIKWSNIQHYFLVGNHESEEVNLQYSSTNALQAVNRLVIDSPCIQNFSDFELAFLPYIVESDKKPLNHYFGELGDRPRILFSHNDLLGIQMGPVVSKTGFSIEELEANCTFCLNGHLHNGQAVSKNILNLGNLTGKDFGEDAFKYAHKAAIIDTETFDIEFIENPHAFNFYKIDILKETDLQLLNQIKQNAIISIRCDEKYISKVRDSIVINNNILETRLVLLKQFSEAEEATTIDISDLVVDQCVKFAECCREKLENSPILEMELAEILK
jgi:DNA repair exonuclease SbcCD nuclease subunit